VPTGYAVLFAEHHRFPELPEIRRGIDDPDQ
jgi:hypothetical protein